MFRIATFSIAAADIGNGEWGVAVASKFLAVGAVVPWARAKVGAVATQALANLTFGPRGLELLENGRTAKEVLDELLSSDPIPEHRQVGAVDGEGGAATYTGEQCLDWAGGLTGENFAIQGNILSGPQVIEEMRDAFVSSTGPLADRLLASLLAGDRAGGDRRGRQSAAIVVAREGGGYGGDNDRAIDLRIDDHPDPVRDLMRIREIHRLLLERPGADDILEIDDAMAGEIQELLSGLGHYDGPQTSQYDAQTAEALRTYMGIENLEERWLDDKRIDRNVLAYIRSRRSAAP